MSVLPCLAWKRSLRLSKEPQKRGHVATRSWRFGLQVLATEPINLAREEAVLPDPGIGGGGHRARGTDQFSDEVFKNPTLAGWLDLKDRFHFLRHPS